MVTPIDVVAHEEVVGVRALAPDLEELVEVVELAVDVPADGHRGRDEAHVRLGHEHFLGLEAESEKQ